MLRHRNIPFQLAYADFIPPLREGDQQLSFLPLCHIAQRTFTVFNPLYTGSTVNFAESIDTVPDNIREVAPALSFAVPRILEKFYSAVALRMREPTWLGRVAHEGEVLIRVPHVLLRYDPSAQETAEAVVDGWLHTGDVGTIDAEGFVRITDRMKDIVISAGGKNVTPSEIENQLKFSPFIADAVVIGDRRKFLSCLVMIDHETVAQLAQERDVPFSTFASLCRSPDVQELIGGEIERVNRRLALVETVKKFRLIEQLLTPEDEELTPTMKLKRTFVNVKYKDLIDSMYERSDA